MNEDGTMARLDDLVPIAQRHALKIGTIRDLIAYRRRHDHLVERRAETRFTSRWGGEWTAISFRSEEHTSELQSLMRISYAVFCLKKKKTTNQKTKENTHNNK